MALAITAATVGFIFVLAMTTSFDFTRMGGRAPLMPSLYSVLQARARCRACWRHIMLPDFVLSMPCPGS